MKRLAILMFAVFIIAACSSNQSDLMAFTETYNENAYEFVSVELLDENKFGEIREEKYGKWQNLYDADGRYYIEAKLDDDDKVKGYHVSISEDEPYERLEGEGFEASQVIVETLELDRDKFLSEYDKALESDGETIRYSDGGYEVSFSEFTYPDEHGGMIINYDKEQ